MNEAIQTPNDGSQAPSGRVHPLVGLRAVGSTAQATRLKALMAKEHRNITSLATHAEIAPGVISRVLNGHGTLSMSSAKKLAVTYGGSHMEWHEDWKREVLESKPNVRISDGANVK